VCVRQIRRFGWCGVSFGCRAAVATTAGEGRKKTAGFAGGFFGNFGCASRAINPLDPPAV
jgi:hypothetical protein